MYKENQQFKNLALNMIREIENFCEANEKFNVCIDTLAQAVINPLKISYIKKDKIEKLAEHASVKITDKPTAEQREKYFNACTLEKFANHFFNKEPLTSSKLEDFNTIVEEAKEAANALLPKSFYVLDAEHIPQIYNHKHSNDSNNEPFSIGKAENLFLGKKNDINSSCMQGKRKVFFEMYNDINREYNTLKIAILTQNNEIVARALVWLDIPTEELDRRKKLSPDKMFIDRIYCKTQGEQRRTTQLQMFEELHKYFNIDTIKPITNDSGQILPTNLSDAKFSNCFNWHEISSKIQDKYKDVEVYCKSYTNFEITTNKDNYNYYPYLDTYQYFDTYQNILSNEIEGDRQDTIHLNCVDGDSNNISSECDCCGSEYDEDELHYIESAEQQVCEDCCVWCEDREQSILTDDAVYNNNTGHYHYRDDLDY